jgi:hypothetical protein
MVSFLEANAIYVFMDVFWFPSLCLQAAGANRIGTKWLVQIFRGVLRRLL